MFAFFCAYVIRAILIKAFSTILANALTDMMAIALFCADGVITFNICALTTFKATAFTNVCRLTAVALAFIQASLLGTGFVQALTALITSALAEVRLFDIL